MFAFFFTLLTQSRKQSTGPWLLFVCENGYGKRVPLSSFKPSRLNRVGLIGSKVCSPLLLSHLSLVGLIEIQVRIWIITLWLALCLFILLWSSFSQFAEDDRLAAVFVVGYSLAGKDITLLPQDVLKPFFL